MRDLNEIRKEINSIDEQLIKLFIQRMDCAKAVGKYKKANGIPILNEEREREILDRVYARGGEYGLYARALFADIIVMSRSLQQKLIDEK